MSEISPHGFKNLADKVVLAYSGGLDTSVAIKWIKEKYGLDVVTCTVDIGQHEDLTGIGERGKQIGAVNHYQIDAKKEFATDYVFPSIKANSLYEGSYPLRYCACETALGRKAEFSSRRKKARSL